MRSRSGLSEVAPHHHPAGDIHELEPRGIARGEHVLDLDRPGGGQGAGELEPEAPGESPRRAPDQESLSDHERVEGPAEVALDVVPVRSRVARGAADRVAADRAGSEHQAQRTIMHMHTVKPLDAETLRDFFEKEAGFDKVYYFAEDAPPIPTVMWVTPCWGKLRS